MKPVHLALRWSNHAQLRLRERYGIESPQAAGRIEQRIASGAGEVEPARNGCVQVTVEALSHVVVLVLDPTLSVVVTVRPSITTRYQPERPHWRTLSRKRSA